jgi:CCR4-NOT transcription complex subunit 4
VLKANKEKEAAAKRERQRQQNDGNSSDGEGVGSGLAGMKGQMEVPRDRSQLANMRVIRRNLVYAVGLPPNIATEEALRKPDYFGQYGKISKIVLNRSQTTGGDLRRASASAYVTFAYKVGTRMLLFGI